MHFSPSQYKNLLLCSNRVVMAHCAADYNFLSASCWWIFRLFPFFGLLQAITDVLTYVFSPCTNIFVWKVITVSKDMQLVSFNDIARWHEKQEMFFNERVEAYGLEVVMRSKENADLSFCDLEEWAASPQEDHRGSSVLWGDLICSSGGRHKDCSGKDPGM